MHRGREARFPLVSGRDAAAKRVDRVAPDEIHRAAAEAAAGHPRADDPSLGERDRDEDADVRRTAEKAIRAIESPAIPEPKYRRAK